MQQELEQARDYLARCLVQHGEAYLPLFERVERELELVQKKKTAMDRARRLAGKI